MGLGKVVPMFSKLLAITLALTAVLGTAQAQQEANFKCETENATCRGLANYKNPNGTTLHEVQTLFNVKHLLDILGANNLPSNTTGNHKVGPNESIKVPFQCKCGNHTGLSNHLPIYTIKAGDGLYDIATTVFAGLVKYPQIQEANKIPDANKINAGDKLWIPLPCSCDEVGGSSVVHYAHLAESGSSIERIAQEYGTTPQILLTLNTGINDTTLKAGQVLDVPLKACSSHVKNDSLDFPLLVANGTYVYTANECVKCKCDSSNNYILQCEPSQHKPTNWSVCPPTNCSSNVFLGNTTSTDHCSRTTCAYAGYSSRNISTILAAESTCPAPSPSGSGTSSPSDSGASRSALQGWVWNHLFFAIHFVLFSVYLLQ